MTIQETTPTKIRAESFPDLADEVMYPRMSEQKLEKLAKKGRRRSFAAGETLYEQGQRDAPFLVIERGRVRVLDRKPGKDVWVADADVGTFLGDIATFTGEPAAVFGFSEVRLGIIPAVIWRASSSGGGQGADTRCGAWERRKPGSFLR